MLYKSTKQVIIEPMMIYIPAGPFLMGTSDVQIKHLAQEDDLAKRWQEKGFFSREQPQHNVTLSNYHISKYPVTVGAYRLFVKAGGYHNPHYWTKAGWQWSSIAKRTQPEFWNDEKWTRDEELPIVGVSWYEAIAYCSWLSKETEKSYRLPTEAEWEKAARGSDGRLYPWGNAFDASHCNTRVNGPGKTVPIGTHEPRGVSPYGCAEMGGNVSEWVLSQYRPYPYKDNDGRNEVEGKAERVIRGGSWYKPVLRARTAARGMNDPFFADNDVGFRCVLDA